MTNYRQYEVWHDENKNNGYWHGILIMPVNNKDKLITNLKRIRNEYGYSNIEIIKFGGFHKYPKRSSIINNHLCFFSHIVKTKIDEPCKLFKLTNKNLFDGKYKPYLSNSDKFDCRFGLLKIEDNFKAFEKLTYSEKVELTYDFLLKSCLHFFFDIENKVTIKNFYFDGNKHHGSNINLQSVINSNKREYIKIPNEIEIDDRQRKNRLDDSGLIIDFVDHVIGAFQYIIDSSGTHEKTIFPLNDLYNRAIDELIVKNKNSRWYKSISLNELKIVNDRINFPKILRDKNQISFF